MRYVEKSILLQTLDQLWREHLIMLEHLRQVIGLRRFGQRDPLNEYKSEAFQLFETLVSRMREAVTAQLMRVEIMQRRARCAAREPALHGGAPHQPGDRDDDFAMSDAVPPWPATPGRAWLPRSPATPTIRPPGKVAATSLPVRSGRSSSTATGGSGRRVAPEEERQRAACVWRHQHRHHRVGDWRAAAPRGDTIITQDATIETVGWPRPATFAACDSSSTRTGPPPSRSDRLPRPRHVRRLHARQQTIVIWKATSMRASPRHQRSEVHVPGRPRDPRRQGARGRGARCFEHYRRAHDGPRRLGHSRTRADRQ